MSIDVWVILIYLVFLMVIGWVFKNFNSDTSDYFRGGGNMLWWLVGSTAFMTQFSAWTFTGAASQAYVSGFAIIFLFMANAAGYFLNYVYFAPRFRQLRVVTAAEALKMRFGKPSEQTFIWFSMFDGLVSAATWLSALAIITSAVFNVPLETVILLTGIAVVAMSVTGGAWAVVASDYVQMLIIMSVTFVCFIVAWGNTESVSHIVSSYDGEFLTGSGYGYAWLFGFWVFMLIIKQIFMMNNTLNGYRYMCAKNSKNARYGALFTLCLALVGPIVWFFPAWFMHAYSPGFMENFSSLGAKANEAVFVAFVSEYMPAGMLGLLMAAMFAASMSSMDSGLNRNAGFFVRNFYLPIIKPHATEQEMLRVSRFVTLSFGAIIIGISLFINSLKSMSLFEILLTASALITFPITIPAMLGMIIRKTPDWSGWGTLVVGCMVSYTVGAWLSPDLVNNMLGMDITAREWSDFRVSLAIGAHVVITGGFFLLSTLFYKPEAQSTERAAERQEMWQRWETPVESTEADPAADEIDYGQKIILGRLILMGSIMVMGLSLLPNSTNGRLIMLLCGALIMIPAVLMLLSARSSKRAMQMASNNPQVAYK
ncbi:sodium:solute symporter family transporter [Vreelandella populi]|uniref:Transporter n=1 Tax=Vreelandella populi TaxID=2498858 RepID=A0A433LCI4_9GAMM|nr:transporter [Halomonas populi]RUR39272.1 transporter [Halomonas populi]RUR46384.1 transporter [Halomonas populi]